MSEKTPRPLAEMRAAAERLVDELRPMCERIEVAGSVRRRKPLCGDVELVCVPRFGELFVSDSLWPLANANLLDDYVGQQLAAGRYTTRRDVNGRGAVGPRYKRLMVDGVALDLFSVLPPASWPVVLLIRTGPLRFSRRVVTPRSHGGLLPDDCQVLDGAVWRGRERVPLETEAEWFALCGIEYREPWERES